MVRAQEEEELDPALPPPTDPFSQLVDSMLREEGVDVDTLVRKPYSPTAGDVTTHDWAMGREALFADEPYQFKCKRCFHYLEVARDQTLSEALQVKGVDPNCSRQIVSDITET
jgi:sugar/nucleoside kinase (ribokinase family)